MTTVLDFDAAVDILRRVHVGGEELPRLAHAAGRPRAQLAAELLAFLWEAERSVAFAARSERKVFHVGAHGRLDEHLDLPAGYRLVPRGHPL